MSVVDEIKQKIDIVEVIGQYTALKKAGRNLTALCPFHSEKNPSFFVYPEQQTWHCFGACNTGGDVFSFIMKKEGLTFIEALRLLAQRAGVALPEKVGIPAKEENEELYRVNEAAAIYFHSLLLTAAMAAKAREYLNGRGIAGKTIADFQLGFSPDGWEALKNYLKDRGFAEDVMLRAGLLVRAEDGRSHDRFRSKLMIPIRDIRGRVIGFGARVLDDSLPKYVNSPQTAIFDKGASLYGIDRAASSIRQKDRAIIVEGYMDVIMAHQCGVTNAVACMGTAITEAQVNAVRKLSRNIVLCLDADSAGEEAVLKTAGYENILGSEIRVAVLPEGKDPDEVMREDISRWHDLIEASVPLIDFMFERTASSLDLGTAQGKSALATRLLPVLAEIGDPIRQAHYLQKLAALAGVDMEAVRIALGRLVRPASARRGRTSAGETGLPVGMVNRTASREENLLALVLQNPELVPRLGEVSPELFESTVNREIFLAFRDTGDVVLLKERVGPLLGEKVEDLLRRVVLGGRDNLNLKFEDCLYELEKEHLRGLAARQGEAGELDIGITQRLKELEARKRQRRPSFRRNTR